MRLPDVLGVLGALVVGGLLAVLLLASVMGEQPALPTPLPPTMPPIPSLIAATTPTPAPTAPPSGGPSITTGVAIGQKAPTIEVTLLDGSVMNTDDFLGKPQWINFMATWCPQCQDELPMMEKYQKQLDGEMTILAVDVGEDPETVDAFIKQLDVNLTVGVDEDGSVQREWGAYALPVHFWLDEQGIVRQIVYGGAPPEVFITAITAVVPDFAAEGTPLPEEVPETAPPEATPEVSPAT